MFVHIAIHRPKSGQEVALLASMCMARDAVRAQPGCHFVGALRDQRSNACIGLALWESRAAWEVGVFALREAVKDVDFDLLEDEPPEVFWCDVVDGSLARPHNEEDRL
jgi:hypothetical protein